MSSEASSSGNELCAVVIGRNEGDRLVRCLRSLAATGARIVYVDSSSTDDSVQRARDLGADVLTLPTDRPFTAGRARNFGFRRALELYPSATYVQFVDGDCEVAAGWLDFAQEYLDQNADAAIVCGRRQERFPERSVYNRLCDIEWDTPVGDAESCGGDFLVRATVFRAARGFNETLIAGEEPEMCYRIRQAGWRIYRADRPMTHHDAAITRFSQWWNRTVRSGYAYAARAALHWRDQRKYCWRENARIVFGAFLFPLGVMLLAWVVSPWCLTLLLVYPLQYVRMFAQMRAHRSMRDALAYPFFVLLGRWPEFVGQMRLLGRRVRGAQQTIIEYK